MKEKKLNEICDGCEYEYDYDYESNDDEPISTFQNVLNTAVINHAPITVASPTSQISVYIKDTEFATASGIESTDIIEFIINFGVTEYSTDGGPAKTFTVKKRLSVSKQSLLAQGIADHNRLPSTMVETTQKLPNTSKSATQRAREIAGIPHPKNYT